MFTVYCHGLVGVTGFASRFKSEFGELGQMNLCQARPRTELNVVEFESISSDVELFATVFTFQKTSGLFSSSDSPRIMTRFGTARMRTESGTVTPLENTFPTLSAIDGNLAFVFSAAFAGAELAIRNQTRLSVVLSLTVNTDESRPSFGVSVGCCAVAATKFRSRLSLQEFCLAV